VKQAREMAAVDLVKLGCGASEQIAVVQVFHSNTPYNLDEVTGSRTSLGWQVENIGPKVNVLERLEKENASQAVKRGYRQVVRMWNETCMRSVRGDLFGGLRAVLYQALLHQLPIVSNAKNLDSCYQKLSKLFGAENSYLATWNFANRLPFARESVQMKLAECLHALFEQVAAVSKMTSVTCREQYLVSLFNDNPDTDLRLLEAVKVLMMLMAATLYDDYCSGCDVPSYVWAMFTRDTSRSAEQLFVNHINPLGDSAKLDETELCLLGHTLGIQIQLVRPLDCDASNDMVSTYPDEGANLQDAVVIIEDDGRYSVMCAA